MLKGILSVSGQPGLFKLIAEAKNRCISVNNCDAKIGNLIRIKIVETKNSIYVADN